MIGLLRTFIQPISSLTMKNETLFKPLIIGAAIVITALVLGNSLKNRNAAEDAISVVGLGTRDFESDEIYWSGSYSVKASSAKEAYDAINRDKEKVKSFFLEKGFTAAEFNFSGVNFNKSYRTIVLESHGETVKTESVFDGYTATQTVNFKSKKNPALMKKIEGVIDQTAELINSGIEFEGSTPQYLYSDLPGLKHNLIENASKDANERAVKIATTANGHLGKLKDASMGVFQITGQGSVEEDSYGGNFDSFSKMKTARITVRLTYNLN